MTMKFDFFKTIFLILITLNPIVFEAQEKADLETPFLRVFNMEGNKIAKGKLMFFNDSVMYLKRSRDLYPVHYSDIGRIKTKRSGGNAILSASMVGTGIGVLIGVSTADPDAWILGYSQGEGALGFGLVGGVLGAGIGGIGAAAKKPITFEINADSVKWEAFKMLFEDSIENEKE